MTERTHEENLEFIDDLVEQGRIAGEDELSDAQYPEFATEEQAELGWQILKAFAQQTAQAAYTGVADEVAAVDRNDHEAVAEAATVARTMLNTIHAVNECAAFDAAGFFVGLMVPDAESEAA